ncbi:MAG: ferrous iron transport protein A, partial [Treponema sp.]|nr:ferrous iron transport protein A [Treponema sp.]
SQNFSFGTGSSIKITREKPKNAIVAHQKRTVLPRKRVEGTENLRQHLESLGFTVGSEVTVVSESGGNLIVNVKNSRIAISRGMAHRILV